MNRRAFDSMRLQTAAIIVAGFVLSHLAGYFFYTEDRRAAVLITEALDVAERAAGVSRLLRDLPLAWREEVVRVSDSRAFRVWTSAAPPFEAGELTEEEADILNYLRAQLPRISNNQMRVRYARAALSPIKPPEPVDASAASAPTDASVGSSSSGWVVGIAISHDEDAWINFVGQINTPASLLPEFVGINIFSAVFGIGLVAFWLVHRVTVPLRKLAEAAERLGRNIYAAPLSETGPREVATAAAAFNRMQRRLTSLIEGRTQLLAAISHDLRTPITQVRLRMELMPKSQQREKLLASLDEMDAIIATFLDYSRASNESEERVRVDVGALVESMCEDLAGDGAAVCCVAESGLIRWCKRLAVKRAVDNLIKNALNYGNRACVAVYRERTSVVIRVDDDGPGIPTEDLEAVLVPFYRGEASRNRDTGGVGLGLSIVQAVAEDHGGEVRLTNQSEGGLRAELFLPL